MTPKRNLIQSIYAICMPELKEKKTHCFVQAFKRRLRLIDYTEYVFKQNGFFYAKAHDKHRKAAPYFAN